MDDKICVLVVDDHPLFRTGVVSSLDSEPDICVIGQTASGQEALRLARELLPDVMLLDITMPGMNGLEVAEKMAVSCPATVIVMLTMWEDKDKLLAAFKAGARSYVIKGVSGSELAEVVRRAAKGEVYVSPLLADEMLHSLSLIPARDGLEELTAREREILADIGAGKTNREIGVHLCLSEKTIKHYVSNILQKLQVRSRVEAAILVVERSHSKMR
jgi:two-component system nitrate/nitrite response regulator NarL